MKFTKEEIKEAGRIADTLISWVEWRKTDEGHDYWNNVHDKLLDIASTKLCCTKCGQPLPEDD